MQASSALLLIPGLGMIAVGVLAVLLWQRGKPSLWRAVAWGALAWVISVALKVAWAVPTNKGILNAITQNFGILGEPVSWIYIGLLTGIFECGITYLIVRITRIKSANWDQAVAFGLAYGAIEAVLLGVSVVVQAFVPQNTVENALNLVLPVVERLLTLAPHTISCVAIVYGIRVRQARWFWLSFAYKTAIDAYAAWGIMAFHVTESISRQVWFEIMLIPFTIVALLWLAFLKRKFHETTATA